METINGSNTNTLLKSDQKKENESSEKTNKKKRENNSSSKEKSAKSIINLKQSFRTLSSGKKVLEKGLEKDKNDRSKFLGDGVTYKAKLIGILEVEEARGDRMCQEALFELKMAVRAAGEHKQRINIVIAIDGIRLRDEKTGDSLYHHPVHKISFIAQDVADSRAFGYIFGSPDTGHRFFGIKTDKAASQVVMSMRDLFQVVYELKKREIEWTKQSIEQHQLKYGSTFFLDSTSAASSKSSNDSIMRPKLSASVRDDGPAKAVATTAGKNRTQTAGVIADLMDLELELNSLQQGLSQIGRLTPTDGFSGGVSSATTKEDPFGDSFTPPPTTSTPPPPAKLPPPPMSGDRRKVNSTSSVTSQPELHWFDKETRDLFSADKGLTVDKTSDSEFQKKDDIGMIDTSKLTSRELCDLFTDLDPLGTGKIKPYVDKKDFFQELKNPPKKVLKELAQTESPPSFADTPPSKSLFPEDEATTTTANDPFETSFANFSSFDDDRKPPANSRSPIMRGSSPAMPYYNVIFRPEKRSERSPTPTPPSEPNAVKESRVPWSAPPEASRKIVINLRRVLSSADDDTDRENESALDEGQTRSPAGRLAALSDSFESIPEPPPRPISAAAPPLPPKRPHPVTMKPPRYDYAPYETRSIDNDAPIPPLPAPVRKPKFRPPPCRSSSESEYYLTPIAKTEPKPRKPKLNITLSELTPDGMEQLSFYLGVSPSELCQMTLKELTDFLASLSDSECSRIEQCMNRYRASLLANEERDKYTTLKDSFDDEASPTPIFKANFEDKFNQKEETQAQVDKYAVFRELIEQEVKKEPEVEPKEEDDAKEEEIKNEEPEEKISVEEVPEGQTSQEDVGKNWATFDTEQETKEMKTSPWQEENVSLVQQNDKIIEERYDIPKVTRSRWDEDHEEEEDYCDDSDENWQGSKPSLGSSWEESSWRENGWSDRDSLYDDTAGSPTGSYRERRYLKKKGYHRKFSPHKKSPSDNSAWEEESRWSSSKESPLPKNYYQPGRAETEEDELTLLKMMLGKKRLKALEQHLFKQYHDRLEEPRKPQRYYKKTNATFSYEDSDAASTDDRTSKTLTRPKGSDKKSMALSLRVDNEPFRKPYRKPYSLDELSMSDDEERYVHQQSPSSYTSKRSSRSRQHSQTSPFDEGYAAVTPTPYYSKPVKPQSRRGRRADSKSALDLRYDSRAPPKSSRDSSQRQSPFEDDFAPAHEEVRKGRPAWSNRYDGGSGKSKDRASSKHYENVDLRKKPAAAKFADGVDITRSPKRSLSKYPARHDPFNDKGYESKTMPRPRGRVRSKNVDRDADSGSDSASAVRWKDDVCKYEQSDVTK